MIARKRFTKLALISIIMIVVWCAVSVSEAGAETLNYKCFLHATKAEVVPIADIEGHTAIFGLREGVIAFETGELGWVKSVNMFDLVKGAGTFDQYTTYTFLDGSTLIVHAKGTMGATPQGLSSAGKITGDVIHGTGRFQGVKGSMTSTLKVLPPEKGEPGPKSFTEGTLVYTLPGK